MGDTSGHQGPSESLATRREPALVWTFSSPILGCGDMKWADRILR